MEEIIKKLVLDIIIEQAKIKNNIFKEKTQYRKTEDTTVPLKNIEHYENKYTCFSDLPDVLTADNISKFLNLSKRRVYDLMDISPEAGGIPCKRIGKSKRVLKDDFEKWLDNI